MYQANNIPSLYETDKISLEKKIIYQKWDLKRLEFYWLIAELDKKQNLAFGYANLNDDVFAEWGYISISELIDNGAKRDLSWQPCNFEEAQKRIKQHKKQQMI
ncbi:MAG: hypothetical protein QXW37_00075 [Candidatus Nitrosotenuis sp.]